LNHDTPVRNVVPIPTVRNLPQIAETRRHFVLPDYKALSQGSMLVTLYQSLGQTQGATGDHTGIDPLLPVLLPVMALQETPVAKLRDVTSTLQTYTQPSFDDAVSFQRST
jgi:hypothetical protein